MDSHKPIKVGVTSSLIDLKAELLRKQQQLKSTRSRDDRGVQKTVKKSDVLRRKLKDNQKNEGVDQRSQKDKAEAAEEEKTLDKSKSILEAKARLYEKLQAGALYLDNNSDDEESEASKLFSNSLVNFQQKAIDEIQEKRRKIQEEPPPAAPPEPPPDNFNEDDWTEFTDALGRTRKCLKADLPSFIERDEALSRPENPGICLSASADDRLREMKREKWELEAELLAARDKVHYQDVLFDEVRNHGTGYYSFARDEATRAQQLKDLKKLSEQTEEAKGKVNKEKSKQNAQLKARLKKIKDKKRAKAGLPPLPDSDSNSDKEDEKKDDAVEEPEPEKKLTEIRAWDVGKAGVFGPKPTTFDELDEKWLKDRRADRNPEFAPPSSIYSEGGLRKQYNSTSSSSSFSSFSSASKYQNFVKSKDLPPSSKPTLPVVSEPSPRPFQPPQTFWKQRKDGGGGRAPPQKPVPIQDELPAPIPESSKEFDRGRGGTEIAPPPTFEYFHGDTRPQKQITKKTSEAAMMDAVSSGLQALREQFEMKKDAGEIAERTTGSRSNPEDRLFHQFR